MSEAQARARRQQRIEELSAASIRALSGIADLHFRGARLHRGRRALPRFAPHLHPSLEDDDFASFRGAADGLALRLTNSQPQLHQSLRPADPVHPMLFELLEQFRCESLVPSGMPGVRHNCGIASWPGRWPFIARAAPTRRVVCCSTPYCRCAVRA